MFSLPRPHVQPLVREGRSLKSFDVAKKKKKGAHPKVEGRDCQKSLSHVFLFQTFNPVAIWLSCFIASSEGSISSRRDLVVVRDADI